MKFTRSCRAGRPAAAILAGALACLASISARSGPVHYACTHQAGGYLAPLSFAIDYDSKTIDVSPEWLQPLPESLEITDAKVGWSFMRGFIEFDRKTLAVDWDNTGEYDYLDAIVHPDTEPRDTYKGRMQCATAHAD
jgi:hypothetical protein